MNTTPLEPISAGVSIMAREPQISASSRVLQTGDEGLGGAGHGRTRWSCSTCLQLEMTTQACWFLTRPSNKTGCEAHSCHKLTDPRASASPGRGCHWLMKQEPHQGGVLGLRLIFLLRDTRVAEGIPSVFRQCLQE